ncbi:MAG: type IX secretion system membrane protein PorP/SprF [Algoriphagus sp.]|nr:type IX secretion system membrane protein PorP/SprF [Algoriphagus sp.]
MSVLKNLLVLVALNLALILSASAQDLQYSQYYAAPLYLNPAMAGAELSSRVGFNYRNQWPRYDVQFTSMSAYYDTFIPYINSGIGVHVMQESEGVSKLRSTSVSLQYSYEIRLAENLYFRPGIQSTYILREIGYSDRLLFARDIPRDNPDAGVPSSTSGDFEQLGLYSFTAGGILFTNNAWIGVAAHHLNKPNQSLLAGESDPLPMKLSFHAGFQIPLEEGSMRRDFLGTYLYLEPILVGAWYRGLPFKTREGQVNRDAIVVMTGINLVNGLNVGYSFDYTISQLGIKSGGAHEVSLSWIIPSRNQGKPNLRDTILPSPKF